MAGGILDVSRTTTLIGELIALITEQEETMTLLGKEGYSYYQAGLFYDDPTLELCRRLDGQLQQVKRSKNEMQAELEDAFAEDDGPKIVTKAKRGLAGYFVKRDISAQERALRENYDELANRIVYLSTHDPRCLNTCMVKMCATLNRLDTEVDKRWKELQSRNKSERHGTIFILVLNQFIVNLFRFSNHTWFRHWVMRMKYFQEKFQDRIHEQVKKDLEAAYAAPTTQRHGTAAASASSAPAVSVPVPETDATFFTRKKRGQQNADDGSSLIPPPPAGARAAQNGHDETADMSFTFTRETGETKLPSLLQTEVSTPPPAAAPPSQTMLEEGGAPLRKLKLQRDRDITDEMRNDGLGPR
jgi:hypothetical protein